MALHHHHHGHPDHDHDEDHDGHHGHGHGAGSGHSHAPASFGRAFAIGITLNTVFVGVGVAYGITARSTALLADAGHNLGDVLGLVIAWSAATLGRRAPQGRYTYGWGSSSILAALGNAVLLLVASTAIAIEAIGRLADPAPVAGGTVMIVAAIGIVVNGATALLFARGRRHDINMRGAFLHMAGDAAISAGVVLAGLAIRATGWMWIDPVVSLAIVAAIVAGTWGLLRDSLAMSLQAVPTGIDREAVASWLRARDGVSAMHDLHIWPMSTTETALTVHLLVPGGYPGDGFTLAIARELRRRFGIHHATVQIETDPETLCALVAGHAA